MVIFIALYNFSFYSSNDNKSCLQNFFGFGSSTEITIDLKNQDKQTIGRNDTGDKEVFFLRCSCHCDIIKFCTFQVLALYSGADNVQVIFLAFYSPDPLIL